MQQRHGAGPLLCFGRKHSEAESSESIGEARQGEANKRKTTQQGAKPLPRSYCSSDETGDVGVDAKKAMLGRNVL